MARAVRRGRVSRACHCRCAGAGHNFRRLSGCQVQSETGRRYDEQNYDGCTEDDTRNRARALHDRPLLSFNTYRVRLHL